MSSPSPLSDHKNCIRETEQYWANNLEDLFIYLNIFPTDSMGIEAKLNSIFRLSFIMFLIMLLMNNKYSPLFLFLTLIINILFYIKYKDNY